MLGVMFDAQYVTSGPKIKPYLLELSVEHTDSPTVLSVTMKHR